MTLEQPISRSFQGIWIPKEIWLNKNISIQAKCLWAEIQSLYSEQHGGCFASDEYLMNFMGLKSTRLQEIFKELRDAGLLKTIKFNGRQRVVKAIMPTEDSGELLPAIPEKSSPVFRVATPRNTGEPSLYIDTREVNRKERGGKPPKTPARAASDSSHKTKRAEHVHTSDDEHMKLAESPHSESLRDEAYRILSEWKSDTPKSKWKKSDYRSIIRWVFDRIQEKKGRAMGKKSRSSADLSPEKSAAYDELF